MAIRSIEGLDSTIRALRETPKEARAVLRDVVRVSTRIIAQRTRQAAPFETGALREAIAEAPKGSSLTGSVVVLPGTFKGRVPSSYVIPLEYGKGPGARPFVRMTAEQEAGPYVARVQAAGKTLERNLDAGRFL